MTNPLLPLEADWETPSESDELELNEAYCVKCKAKVEMLSPEPVWTRKGSPGTRGDCAVCGTTVFRMGKTSAHDRLPSPGAVQVETRTKIATDGGRRRGQPATFLNFVAEDRAFAEKLASDLADAGLFVWLANGSEGADSHWAGGVHPALKDSANMVIVLSEAAMSNVSFNTAWQLFRPRKKPVVLATLGEVPIPDDLRRCARFAFTPSDEKEYQSAFLRLLAALHR
ncbi:MAG: hypothetical protein OHK0023_24780 [Anaerolineae bacterium]